MDILIVDDSAVMRAMILKSFRMTGLEIGDVFEAENGQKGLAQLSSHSVDLVVADINMPVMDGVEMIRRMKAADETASIPILVISTEGSETRWKQLEEMGAAFIQKPFSPEKIRDTIQTIMGRKS